MKIQFLLPQLEMHFIIYTSVAKAMKVLRKTEMFANWSRDCTEFVVEIIVIKLFCWVKC